MAGFSALEALVEKGDPQHLFSLDGELAVGSFGTVYTATPIKGSNSSSSNIFHFSTNDSRSSNISSVALKVIELDEEEGCEDAVVEVEILKRVMKEQSGKGQEFITGFFGAWLSLEGGGSGVKELWVAMELCEGGSLLQLFEDFDAEVLSPCTENEIAFIVESTLRGLRFLHEELLIIHRDIKAANILVTADGHIKLADFGVSAQLTAKKQHRQTLIGTPFWMAPEVIAMDSTAPYGVRADVWSLGITLIELAEREPPLSQLQPMRALCMIPGNPPPQFTVDAAQWSKEMVDFLSLCLKKDPSQRPSCAQLLEHPWIKARAFNVASLQALLTRHRAIVAADAERMGEITNKWKQFLEGGSSDSNSRARVASDGNISIPTESMESGTVVQHSGRSAVPAAADALNPARASPRLTAASSIHVRRASGGQHELQRTHIAPSGRTFRQTVIDPRTMRPHTVRVDANGRDQDETANEEKRALKVQLKAMRKLQQKHQRKIDDMRGRLAREADQLTKALNTKMKKRQAHRTEFEANMAKSNEALRLRKINDHQAENKALQRQLRLELRARRRRFADKQKRESKAFHDAQKKSRKQWKSTLRQQDSKAGRKTSELREADLEQRRELHFQRLQEMDRAREEHATEHRNLDRYLKTTEEQQLELHEMQRTHLLDEAQARMDSLLVVQEIERELMTKVHALELARLPQVHEEAQQNMKQLFDAGNDAAYKALAQAEKQELVQLRSKLKTDFSHAQAKLKVSLASASAAPADVKSIQKGKKRQHEEFARIAEKDIINKYFRLREREQEDQRQANQLQWDALLASQDKERTVVHQRHAAELKQMEKGHHAFQVQLLRKSRILSLDRSQRKSEEDFSRDQQKLVLDVETKHQKKEIDLLDLTQQQSRDAWAKNHQPKKAKKNKELFQLLTDANAAFDEELANEHRDTVARHAEDMATLQQRLHRRFSRAQAVRDARTKYLEDQLRNDVDSLVELHKQRRGATDRQLARMDRALTKSLAVNEVVDVESGQTRLHLATMEGDLQKAVMLVQSGCDVNLVDKQQWTAMHAAAKAGNEKILNFLINQPNAEVTALNDSKNTILHYVARFFLPENYSEERDGAIVATLCRKGSDLAATNTGGETVLHCVALSGNISIARELVRRGADAQINSKTNRFETPLCWAIRGAPPGSPQVRVDLVRFLLEHGADPTQPLTADGVRSTDPDKAEIMRIVQESGNNDAVRSLIVRALQHGLDEKGDYYKLPTINSDSETDQDEAHSDEEEPARIVVRASSAQYRPDSYAGLGGIGDLAAALADDDRYSAQRGNSASGNTGSETDADESSDDELPSYPADGAIHSMDAERCPVCGDAYDAKWDNARINTHIDECLNAQALDDSGTATSTSTPLVRSGTATPDTVVEERPRPVLLTKPSFPPPEVPTIIEHHSGSSSELSSDELSSDEDGEIVSNIIKSARASLRLNTMDLSHVLGALAAMDSDDDATHSDNEIPDFEGSSDEHSDSLAELVSLASAAQLDGPVIPDFEI